MTTLATAFLRHWPAATQKAERTAPAHPNPGPVFIHDAITGANHTTLLHQLWRRWDDQRVDD